MTNSTVNYTPEMIAIMSAQAPLDYIKAQALAITLERNVRSVIAKAKREGIEYISKPAPAKKKAAPVKADIVAAIASALDAEIGSLAGLEKATGQGLSNLLACIR
jgi:hypothetical protein|tara:strand:- start:83 stop:397 length:315 start_codon:yes stop_codon:yes gene_type:complete